MNVNYSRLVAFALAASLWACKTAQTVKVDSARGELVLFSSDDPATAMALPKDSSSVAEVKANLVEETKSHPDSQSGMLNLAQVQIARGELDEAEATARQILRKNLKNDSAKIVLATVYYRRGLNEMAAIILEGLGGAKSRDSQILNLLGLIAIEKGENARAMALFNESLRVNSSDIATRMNMGVLHLKYGKTKEASVQFERVLSVLPQHEDAKLHMAAILTSRGQYEEAARLLKDVLKTSKNNPVALYNYAVLQSETKEYDDALETLKSYITGAKTKSVHTDKAFALISEIRGKMAASGKDYSNEEIQVLAKELDKKDREAKTVTRTAKVESNSQAKPTPSAAPMQKSMSAKSNGKGKAPSSTEAADERPVSKITKKPAASENIEDLEKELMK